MKIAPLAPAQSINFRRRLTVAEEKEMAQVDAQAKELLGNTGHSVLIVHDACLPQSAVRNTGVANILNTESAEFFDFAKTYFGINTIEVFPQGEFVRKHKSGLVCAYGYSALGLNDSLIDAESLTTPKWNNILLPQEFQEIVNANDTKDKRTVVNFENLNRRNSVFNTNMHRAYDRFMALDNDEAIRVEFESFKRENDVWLTPKVVYNLIKKENRGRDWEQWQSGLDQQLYVKNGLYSAQEREYRIGSLLRDNRKEADFFKFKQFMAEKHLQAGRQSLNAKGLKLFGDMPIKFSKDEVWANPQAFLLDHYVGANDWKAPCLDYPALRDENSAASELLKLKSRLFARRYDGTRIDVSWMYVNPKMIDAATDKIERIDLGDTALRLIEREFENIHGANYSPQNIIHEFKAGREDFSMFKDGELRPEVVSRVAILESENMESSWGHADAYFNTHGMSRDSVIYGVGDHTAQPLRQIAAGMDDVVAEAKGRGRLVRCYNQADVLAGIFNDTKENMLNPAEFIRAKFADTMSAKHNFMFYMDPLGCISRFDSQGLNRKENYRYKIAPDFKELYHKAVQRGQALNLPDALAKAFEKAGLDKEYGELYGKLCKFAKILKEKEPKGFVDKFENTSNGLGLKKWAFIAAGTCVIAALGAILLKPSANNSNKN